MRVGGAEANLEQVSIHWMRQWFHAGCGQGNDESYGVGKYG